MGEAWFMGETRRMFPELMGVLDELSAQQLVSPLEEIATGALSFGPEDEWREWFHYLLPRLIPRAHERFVHQVLELLATALFAFYPDGLEAGPYRQFREDVLATLGRCPMDSACWPDGLLDVERVLNPTRVPSIGLWGWDEPKGPLSASMFLCLKYLRPSDINGWLASVFQIDEPHWRAGVMAWLLGAHEVLKGLVLHPCKFDRCYPPIDWDWSHALTGSYLDVDGSERFRGDFIPKPNRDAALAAVRDYFDEKIMLEWIESLAREPEVAAATDALPLWLLQAYKPNDLAGS